MEYIAHFRQESDGKRIFQTVPEHNRNAARYAYQSLEEAGLETAGYLAGLIHDLGKMKTEFQNYLLHGEGHRGSVNHTFAGCRMILENFHSGAGDEPLTAELLAYAIGAHHGQFDCVDESGASGFLRRMNETGIGYEECLENFLEQCADLEEIQKFFQKANQELVPIYDRLQGMSRDGEEFAFYLGLLARLLLSAVIEGDRRDTAEFMNGAQYPAEQSDLSAFWGRYLAFMENKLNAFPQDTAIQRARRRISDQCCQFAEKPSGVYRLNVPTGGGKTLSSLRYALAHAKQWGKRRLIFISPLLAILEQNVQVIRDYLGDDSIVLEHHSNVLRTEEGDSIDLRELAVESWNSPVIVTTLVQLLNALFDGKTTSIRRFQSLCGSVIVIDEVQTVPTRMLSMFDLAVNFLSEVCGATVLLCSATQPCLEKAEHPLRVGEDMIPYDPALWQPFRRTKILDAGKMNLDEIAGFAREILTGAQSLLIVCNKKDEAQTLFQALNGAAERCCHLSAAMCTAHRRETLISLDLDLRAGKKCLCVSTQVVEAGVDISFQRVIRLEAGMDSVIQSAGRCNRNGENQEPVPVYIVQCLGETLGQLQDIQKAQTATNSLLEAYRRNPDRFSSDLSSDESIKYYYQKLYGGMNSRFQDYYEKRQNAYLFDLLSINGKYYDGDSPINGMFSMNQAFRLAGDLFQVFDDNTRDVVVPYGEGESLILELTAQENPDPAFLTNWLRRAKPYTVAVYDYQLRSLGDALTEYAGVMILNGPYYDKDTGLKGKPGTLDFLEV